MTGNAPDGGPVIMAIAGPNGAGKTTFFHSQLREAGLRFVNADHIASELNISPYEAAALAEALRCELVRQRESFIFETVFSDPVGAKLGFLSDAVAAGYRVVLCFIGIAGVEASEERVAMRVSQGGHDVPSEKLVSRFPRTLANLRTAIQTLPSVLVFDNTDLAVPFRKVAEFRGGKTILLTTPIPGWLAALP
jgi:predicted ABC-type ATPase